MVEKDDRLVVVDVGAAGGLKDDWLSCGLNIFPILFEPSEQRVRDLRPRVEGEMHGRVIACALGSQEEKRPLNVTAAPGCTSLLIPNNNILQQFSVRHAFEIRNQSVVSCRRFDDVALTEGLPQPDAVKVDVQGFEHQVLLGFGKLLDDVLAIELEAHAYPLYKDQSLLGDLIPFLASKDLLLRKVAAVDHFDGYAVEFDMWFTKGPNCVCQMDRADLAKLEAIERVWDLPSRRTIFKPEMFLSG